MDRTSPQGRLRHWFVASRSEQGVAAVEMAIILPLLMLILFGIINFGTVFYNYSVLTNAAREGARWGAVHINPTEPAAQSCSTTQTSGTPLNPCIVANRQAQNLLISYGATTNIKTTAELETSGDEYILTVSMHTDYRGIGFFKSFFENGLTATSRMYIEPSL